MSVYDMNQNKLTKFMEAYNGFIDRINSASYKYTKQLLTLRKTFIAQLQEQGKLPPKVSSYDQLSSEQKQLVDAMRDEHFATIDPTLPLVFEVYDFLDEIIELEHELLNYWKPIINNSKSFERNGELTTAEIAQVDQFRKKIRSQSVEFLKRINSNMLQIARSCKDAELVAAARSYLILHDRMVNMYAKSRMLMVNERYRNLIED